MSANTLHDLFYRVMDEYGNVFDEVYATRKFANPFGSVIRRDIPAEISKIPEVDKKIYRVEGKCGIGQWTAVPYIPIFDKRITTSAKKGVYIVYLINKDRKEMTLAFGLGTTEGVGMYSKNAPAVVASSSRKLTSEQISGLKAKCDEIREKIGSATSLVYDEANNSGAEGYDAACVYNKKYTLDSLPDDAGLKADLMEFLAVYKKYYELYVGGIPEVPTTVFDHWPSGARDTTEFPKVSVEIDASMRDHLKAFTQMDGVGWTDYDAMNAASGSSMTGSRLRTYRKMYEKCGLIFRRENKLRLSRLGHLMATLQSDLDEKKEEVLDKLRVTATDILSRYQLKNPLDNDPLPDDCDILPAICIWKAMRELNNKLHPEEVNRVILRVMKMEELDEAIETIKTARELFDGKYEGRSEEDLQEALGDPVHTDQVQARIAPWFSFVGWGGLIIEQSVDDDGYRNLVTSAIPMIDKILENPPEYYQAIDEEDWLSYYIGLDNNDLDSKLDPTTKTFSIGRLPNEFNSLFTKRFITSLLAKPFVILTGNSGTGKTRISRLFAEYLEARSDDNEKNWVLVPVGADWTDNTKILGFYNPLADEGKGKYEKTEILRLIEHANNNKSKPYFIILDEMNLSHVERYFADFLSHMETKNIPFVLDGYEGEVEYPSNLFVVGTVNIDETTYMFSPKVLDRANVIEFKPDESSVLDLFINPGKSKRVTPANDGTSEAFLKLAVSIRSGISNLKEDALYDIQSLFRQVYKITEKYGYEFAYRTVKEIRQYIIASYEILDDKESFDLVAAEDEQLLQKILPKIHGNKKEIGQLLEELDTLCEQNNLKLSQEKIRQMKGKLAKVQYASFI